MEVIHNTIAGKGDTYTKGNYKHFGKQHVGVCFLKDKNKGRHTVKVLKWTKTQTKPDVI